MKTYLAVSALALMAMVAGTFGAYEADQAQYWRKQYDAVKSRPPCPDLRGGHAVIDCEASTGKCESKWSVISSGASTATSSYLPGCLPRRKSR